MIRRFAGSIRQGFEPEVVDTISRMTVKPTSNEASLYNTFIVEIKEDNGLNLGEISLNQLFDFIYIRASHDKQAALLNWVSSSFDSVLVPDLAFTKYEGFEGDLSGYIDTTFNDLSSRKASTVLENIFSYSYIWKDATDGLKSAYGVQNGGVAGLRNLPKISGNTQITEISTASNPTTNAIGFYGQKSIGRNAQNNLESLTTWNAFEQTNLQQTNVAFINGTISEHATNRIDIPDKGGFKGNFGVSFFCYGGGTIDQQALRTSIINLRNNLALL